MAGSNNFMTYLLLGGAAYIAYEYFFSTPTVAAATATTPATPVTPTTPVVAYVPPTTTQQLQAAAGAGVTALNADGWSFYWAQIGQTAIPAATFDTLFFPNGRPASSSDEPTMTAAAFVSALQGAGLAGYRRGMGAYRIPVPIVRGRGFGNHYTLGDLRRAGGR